MDRVRSQLIFVISNYCTSVSALQIPGDERHKWKHSKRGELSDSSSSTISTTVMQKIIEKLRIQQYQESTRKSYLSAWRSFNEFYIKLDRKLQFWEDRLVLFVGHLVHTRKQASTIKSYISAIRAVLREDGYELNENRYLLNALTKACKLKQNKVKTTLPIQKGLMEIIIKYISKMFGMQPYLSILYQALFTATYFGLFRIGEVTSGLHPVKALDVYVADNSKKFKFILRTS